MEPLFGQSAVAADYRAGAGRTWPARVGEHGSLRLRHPHGPRCQAVLVNTGGGVVAGDHLSVRFDLGVGAHLIATSVAAEKIYRSDGRAANVVVTATLAEGARLAWLPQETILFDGARVRRSFHFDLYGQAALLAAEITVFGRLASGEADMEGSLRDHWQIRRDGCLLFADLARIEGRIGAILDRPAVADGGRAVATVLYAALDAGEVLDGVRAACEPAIGGGLDAGASLRDGVLVTRLIAREPERLRATVAALIAAIDTDAIPRSWA